MASISALDTGLSDAQPLGKPSPGLQNSSERAAVANRTVARQHKMTPEQATAQMFALQSLTIPPDVMAAQSEAVKAEMKAIEEREFSRALRENPALARYAAKRPQFAAISQQELQDMTGLKKKLEQQSAAWRQSSNQDEADRLWWKEAIDRDISPMDRDHRTDLELAIEKSGNIAREGLLDTVLLGPATILPGMKETVKQGGAGAVIGGVLGGIATRTPAGIGFGAKILGGAGVGRASMQREGGAAYKEYIGLKDVEGNPIDREAARTAAIIVGLANGGFEIGAAKILSLMIPDYKKVLAAGGAKEAVKQLLLVPTKRQAFMNAAKTVGKVWVGENAIEFGQAFMTQTGNEIAMNASGQEFSLESRGYDPGQEGIYPKRWGRELGENIKQTAATLVLLPVPFAAVNIAVDVAVAKQAAKAQEQAVKDIADFHSKSSFAKRDPESVKQYATEVGKDTETPSVYIPVEKFRQFFQEGAGEAVTRLTGDTKALIDAEVTGGMVEIPVGDYLTKLVGTPAHDALVRDIKFAPDSLTANEIEELIEGVKEQDKAATEAAESGTTKVVDTAAVTNEYNDLMDNLIGQLMATGHTPQGAEAFATLMAGGYQAAAKATGKTIQEIRDAGFEPVIERAVSKAMLRRGSAFAQSVENNASGESSASLEAQGRLREEAALGRSRMLIDRDGTVTPLIGVDAVDQQAREGQVIVQRGVGAEEWTVLSHGENVKRGHLKGILARSAPELSRAAKTLNQSNRGVIQFTDDGKALITLLADADRSTFLHETGHLFLEMLRWAAAQPDATPETVQRMDTLLKWFGVESVDQITEKHHEQFADGFLTYLREGKAPSSRLREIFNVFGTWLTRLYKDLRINGVVLNDDVRKVMDALVESEQEIAQVEWESGHDQIVEALRAAGVPDLDIEVLVGDIDRTHQDMVQKLTQSKLKLLERKHQSWWQEQRKKVENRVRAALWQQPVYKAISLMTTGKLPDGTFPSGARWFRLDKASLEAVYGKGSRTMEALKNAGYYRISKDNKWVNMSQHDAAKVFGMQSGDELVQSILNAPKLEDAIQAETDAEMRRLFADASFDITLAADARNSVLAEQAPELLEKVLRMVRKAQNNPLLKAREKAVTEGLRIATKPSITAKTARQIAAVVIGNKNPSALSPGGYRVQADKHLRQALSAIRKRDWQTAATSLEASIMNRALFTEATKQKQKVGKLVAGWRKQSRRKVLDKVGKQAGAGYAEALELIFDAVGIRTVGAERKAQLRSFNEWFEERRQAGAADPDRYELPPTTSDLLRSLTESPKAWTSLTVEQIKTIDEDIQELRALASFHGKTRLALRGQQIKDIVAQAAEEIEKSGIAPRETVIERKDSPLAKYIGIHRRLMTALMILDGAKDNGFFWNTLGKHYTQSANNQTEWNTKTREQYLALVKQYGFYDQLDFTTPYLVPGTKISLSRAGRVMVALLAGSELNRKHLLEGGLNPKVPLTEGDLQKIIDTLDEKDIEFIKGVWKINDELFHYVQMHDRRVRGKAPVPKKRQELVTRFGVLEGGYMPIRENPQHSIPRNVTADGIARAMMTGDLSGVMPSDSFTKEAKKGAKHSPLDLSLSLVEQHMAEVVHYLAWHEYLVDAYRILGNRDMANTIRQTAGNEFYTEMLTNLKTVAHGDLAQYSVGHRLIDVTATASSIMLIGFNVATMLLQPLGLFSSWSRLGGVAKGAPWIAAGVKEFYRHPFETLERVRAESAFMDSRAHMVTAEQERAKASLMGQIGKSKAAKAANLQRQFTTQFAFFGIVKMQTPVDVITWLGAKEKAMAAEELGGLGMSEADARLYADEIVASSQGSGRMADLPSILQERGGLRLMTGLMTFFAAQTNQYMIRNAALRKAGIKSLPDYMGHVLLLMVLPAVANAVFQAWRRDEFEDDDEDAAKKLAKSIALEVAIQPALGLIGARELVGAVQGYQWRGTAGTASVMHAANFISQTGEWEMDEGWIRSALMAQSLLTGVGGTQAWRVYQGIEAAADDDPDTSAIKTALFGEPAKK